MLVASAARQTETSAAGDDDDVTISPMHGGPAMSSLIAIEDEELPITPQNISIQYYRRETLRVATVVMLLAFVDLWMTPLDAFLLLPASLAASYWLRDSVRFSHGGDIRKCFNRDCSLMYFYICAGAAIAISAIDCAVLSVNFSKSEQLTSATQSSAATGSGDVRASTADAVPVAAVQHSATWFALAIGLNATSLVTLLYGFYCIRKLRRLLDVGGSIVHAATAEV